MVGAMRGSIQRRGQSSWRIRIYLGRHPETGEKRWLSETVRGTRAEADKACARLVTEVGAGFHANADHTVGELVNRWFAHASPDFSPYTVRDYRSTIDRHIVPLLGERKIGRVRASDLEQLYRELDVGPQRIRRIHNILGASFDAAIRWQWMMYNPCRAARPPKVVEAEIRCPEPEEVRRLITYAENADPDLAAYLRLAADSGARRGELVALHWSDVDLERGTVVITKAVTEVGGTITVKGTKNGTTRRIAIATPTVAALRGLRGRQRETALSLGRRSEDGPVFTSDPLAQEAWRPDFVSRRFRRVTRAVGLPSIRLHDLRHFVATRLIVDGIDPKTVAARLGHRSASMVFERYAHFVPESDRKAAEGLGRLMAGD
jgi:integrase